MAGSLISNNSEYLIQSLVANKIGIENYYQSFSRDQEREADYYSIETLNKLNISSKPLVNFLNFLEKKSIQKGLTDEYYKFSSHPIYKERYEIIDSNKNINNLYLSDSETSQKFNYIKAKFFGFTESNINILKEYLDGDYLLYSKSIIFSKKGKLKDSMKILNKLIEEKKNYIFILETKADILYSNGFNKQALLFYEKISKINLSNHYINKRIFNIKFTIFNIDNENLNKALFDNYSFLLKIFSKDRDLKLKFQLLAEKNNYINWVNYFLYEQISYNKNNDLKDIANNMIKIREKTNDKILINLINNRIKEIN